MADKTLKFNLTATDNASSTFEKVGGHAESATSKIGASFGKLGSKIGGELGEVLDTIGEGLEKTGEHGQSAGKKLMAMGAGVTGLGVALSVMGSKDKAAEQQLSAAIEATGGSMEELEPKIKTTISSMEGYGHSAVDTMGALQRLTTATNDPEKALKEMGLTANLAAAQHISLSAAAGLVAKILNGSGSRTLKQYGITMATTGDKTANADAALAALSGKLKGQASAAADTFSGKLLAVKTRAEDAAAAFGAKFGGAITVAGPLIMGMGAILETGIIQKAGAAAKGMLSIGAAAVESSAETVAAAGAAEGAVAEEAAAVESSGRAMAISNPLFLAGAVVVGTLGKAYMDGKQAAAAMAQNVSQLTDALQADNNAIGKNVTAIITKQLADKNMLSAVTRSGLTVEQYTEALGGNEKGLTANQKATVALTDLTGNMHKEVATATKKSEELSDAQRVASGAQGVLAAKTSTTTASMIKAQLSTDKDTRAMQLANNAAGLLTAAFDKLNGAATGTEESEIAFRNSLATATAGVKDNGTSLSLNTQKGRDNTSAVLDAIKAASSHAEAVANQTHSVARGTAAYNSDISALRKSASAAGFNKGQINAMISAYGRVPRNVATTAKLIGAALVAEQLRELTQPRFVKIKARTSGTTYGRPLAQATGSEYTPRGTTLVGEDGPELVEMPQGARVSNASRTKSALAGAGTGGDTYHINVNVAGSIRSDKDVAAVVVQQIALMQQRRGAVNIYGG